VTFLFFSLPLHGQNHDRGRQHLSLLIVTVAGAILLAAQQLAEADPAGWAAIGACLACQRAVEQGGVACFRRAAELEAVRRPLARARASVYNQSSSALKVGAIMRLLLLVAADCANITADNKLNVMGIFNEVRASQFPARYPSMHLVVKLAAELGEYGQKRDLTVNLHDPDGQPIVSVTGQVDVPKPVGGARPEVNAIFNIRDIVFQHPGPHQFIVLVDKDFKGDLPINVVELPTPTQA